MCFCNPRSFSHQACVPLCRLPQLSAVTSQEGRWASPSLADLPQSPVEQMPRPQLLFAPQPVVCLQELLLAPCKGRKNNWLPGKQTGVKYLAQLVTLRAEACLCYYRSDKEQPPCLPFHPSCHPAGLTGSSPVFSDVAQRRMLLMLPWLQPCQRNGNLWGKPWGVWSSLQHRSLCQGRASPVKNYVNKILLFSTQVFHHHHSLAEGCDGANTKALVEGVLVPKWALGGNMALSGLSSNTALALLWSHQ